MMCYFFPLLGGILSDSYWNKFKTILGLSIVYFFGTVLLAVTSIPGVTGGSAGHPSPWGVIVSLFLIAVGTGGIKACVSSFGGDSYLPHQEKARAIFFSAFYFTINFGTTFAKLLTPLLKENVSW